MAIPAVNLTYLGNGPTASGQVTSNLQGGPLGKTLVGIGTATLDGAASTFTVNWVDGTQRPFGRQIVLTLIAAATASGGNTVYTSPNADSSIPVGTSVVVAGFTTSANNGTFTVVSTSTSTITLNNASGVAELNPAATLVANIGGIPIGVLGTRISNSSTFVADTAVATNDVVSVSAVTATGATVTISSIGTAAQTLSILCEIYFIS